MSQRGWMGMARGWMTVSVLAVGLLGTATVAAARLDAHRAASSETARATGASAVPAATATVTHHAPRQPAAPTAPTAPAAAEAEPEPPPATTPARSLRRLRGEELNPGLVRQASRIIREHHREPFGTEIPFELDGRAFVGRIERHYHPEGGPLKPWGTHAGCSLFAVEGR